MEPNKLGMWVILLFMIFLSYASSEELPQLGRLSSPGPLVFSSDTASDANASGIAISASIETARYIMGNASENNSLEDQEALGLLPSGEEINAYELLNAFETMEPIVPTQSLAEDTRIASVLETSENQVTIQLKSIEYNITKGCWMVLMPLI